MLLKKDNVVSLLERLYIRVAIKSVIICVVCAGGEWRLKYERAIREIEFTKKRLQQEFDDKLEVEQQNKRQLERKVRAHTYKFVSHFNVNSSDRFFSFWHLCTFHSD